MATIQLGATTPSYDLEHEIDATYPTEHITRELVEKTLKTFVGEIQQIPPAFSACKVDGARAYDLARKGQEVELKPKLLVIDDSDQPLTMADVRLEEAIVQTKAKMVVLDPIQDFLGADVDMHRANEIRPLMKRIAVLSEKYHCAVILIGHMNKISNGKSSYRGLGSIDFQAAA